MCIPSKGFCIICSRKALVFLGYDWEKMCGIYTSLLMTLLYSAMLAVLFFFLLVSECTGYTSPDK